MKNMYGLLAQFSNGTRATQKHLTRKYGLELVNEAIRLEYIEPCGTNKDNETIYRITEKGKCARDE